MYDILSDPMTFRLSDSLRLFSSVSRRPNRFDECDSDDAFYRLQRRELLIHKQRNYLPLWYQLSDSLHDSCDELLANDLLSKMKQLGQQLIGSEVTNDLVESSAIYGIQCVFNSIYLKHNCVVTPELNKDLVEVFANQINDELVDKVFAQSMTILDQLDSEERERLFNPFKPKESPAKNNCKKKVKNYSEIMAKRFPNEEKWADYEYKDIEIDPLEDNTKITVEWDSILDTKSKSKTSTAKPQYTPEDIVVLRKQREEQLLNTTYAPFIREMKTEETLDPLDYPFVFDASIDAKATAAVIAGTKMILPYGFRRTADPNNKWEEITIPAPSPPPTSLTKQLIPIESLDEFCKIGFNGIKELNRIQSVLFETAYTTLHNMLVCAPTGAGKTNVALLAILNQIRSAARNGNPNDIALGSFKIIYIAPMKALAAEMTDNLSQRLKPFRVRVRELTGDMQLTRNEIMFTQILVTTPEKWDVVTRKTTGNALLLKTIRLLIIDEVHLLQSERGPVLEALVVRTKRFSVSSGKSIRMVGLSATLPNYRDVAEFLAVTPKTGLFVFDNRFRPVPLTLNFIGFKTAQPIQQMHDIDEICYQKVEQMVREGHQVMVFVHARNWTHRTANNLKEKALKSQYLLHFNTTALKSKNRLLMAQHKGLPELLDCGLAIHHAGMLRQDRTLVEDLFRDGVIKVLVCTATLAWGVNLPTHSVVIKGTEMYDTSNGDYFDISILDVMQIFGRAGRPQYDTEGVGTIITAHNKLPDYLALLTNQCPIESNFRKYLTDNLNAEVVSRTVQTISDAIDWISGTYLMSRMKKNPKHYCISDEVLKTDKDFYEIRRQMMIKSAENLDRALMIRYNPKTGALEPTDLGRIASYFYIKYETIVKFNETILEHMESKDILAAIANAQEFDHLKTRPDELNEIEMLLRNYCKLPVPIVMDCKKRKVIILMQAFLSRARIESYSLISDSLFIVQNIKRIIRGLFEYTLTKGWAPLALKFHNFTKMFERKMWSTDTPFRQFNEIHYKSLSRIENSKLTVQQIRALSEDEIGRRFQYESLKRLANCLPKIEMKASLTAVKDSVIAVELQITPDFNWNERYNGKTLEPLWVWVSGQDSENIYYSKQIYVTKSQVMARDLQILKFNIRFEDNIPAPKQFNIHSSFDNWLGTDLDLTLPFPQN